MQFREVTEFIPGTKYRIVCNVSPCAYEGIYVSTNYLHRFKHVPTFKNLEYVNFIPDYHTYYVPIFQRHHIQSNMEHRAVNLILKNIIGDPTFSWVGRAPTNGVLGVPLKLKRSLSLICKNGV